MLRKRLRERHIQTTCMEKLAAAIAPEPILSIVVFANLTDRGISPIKVIITRAKYDRRYSFPFHVHIVTSIDIQPLTQTPSKKTYNHTTVIAIGLCVM